MNQKRIRNQENSIYGLTVLKVLYRHKIWLIAITLLVGVIAFILTSLKPKFYASTAAILIKTPEITVAGEAAPLNVQTLNSLVKSTSIKWDLFTELKTEEILKDNSSFDRFQQMLQVSLLSTGTRMKKRNLPIIELTATSRTPELSMTIANRWAEIVMKKTKSIYMSEIDDLGRFISDITKKADADLIKSEEAYTSALLNSKIEISKTELAQNNAMYSKIYAQSLELNEEANTKAALIKELEKRLGEQEINGIWAGEIFAKFYLTGDNKDFPIITPQTSHLAGTIQSLIHNERSLAQFEEESNLQFKEIQLANKEEQLTQIAIQIVAAQGLLRKSEKQYNVLVAELEKIPNKLTLNKAITDDVLWNAHLQDNINRNEISLPLKTEIINPVYQTIHEAAVALSGETKGMQSSMQYYGSETKTLEKEMGKLVGEIILLKSHKNSLVAALKNDRQMLEFITDEYSKVRQRYEILKTELLEIRVTADAGKESLERLARKIQNLEDHIFVNQTMIADFKRKMESIAKVRLSLISKTGEVALLRFSTEYASRSGTALLYKAQANKADISSNKNRTVLAAMVATFLILSSLIVVNKFVHEL